MDRVRLSSSVIGYNVKPFGNLTSEQVMSVHLLLKLLRRLRVCFVAKTSVHKVPLSESGKPDRYSIEYITFSEETYMSADDYLDRLVMESSKLHLYGK
jgi:hypothetical protein